ncbi:hypothetical protein FQA39_LY06755 [Lamprigera yunnana]|nr:hypothetical protein FQA39_LY06755 [Lamprigera yunnana]
MDNKKHENSCKKDFENKVTLISTQDTRKEYANNIKKYKSQQVEINKAEQMAVSNYTTSNIDQFKFKLKINYYHYLVYFPQTQSNKTSEEMNSDNEMTTDKHEETVQEHATVEESRSENVSVVVESEDRRKEPEEVTLVKKKQFASPKQIPRNKKLKTAEDPRVQESYHILKAVANRKKDRFDVFSEYVSVRLRTLDERSSMCAEKTINDILFDAEMGKYSGSSTANPMSPGFSSTSRSSSRSFTPIHYSSELSTPQLCDTAASSSYEISHNLTTWDDLQ